MTQETHTGDGMTAGDRRAVSTRKWADEALWEKQRSRAQRRGFPTPSRHKAKSSPGPLLFPGIYPRPSLWLVLSSSSLGPRHSFLRESGEPRSLPPASLHSNVRLPTYINWPHRKIINRSTAPGPHAWCFIPIHHTSPLPMHCNTGNLPLRTPPGPLQSQEYVFISAVQC